MLRDASCASGAGGCDLSLTCAPHGIFDVPRPPLVPVGASAPPPGVADPVPQALVLTAIVIGFALTAFAAVLVKRVYRVTGTDDSDALRTTDS